MTLQTDAFAIETGRSHVSFGVPGCSPLGFSATFGERMIRLAPKYADICELQRRCGAPATLHVVDSRYGHDAFLKEDAQIGALLQEILNPTGVCA